MKTSHLFTYDFRPGHVYHIPLSPHNVMLDVGYQCNLRCQFCYNHDGQFKSSPPNVDIIKRILESLALCGVREVLYLGGEPLLFEKFDEILKKGIECNLTQRIVTNGLLLDEKMAVFLAEHRIEVGVSVCGTTPDTHDSLTQCPGAFDRVMDAMECLHVNRASWFVQYTPTRGHAELLSLVDLLQRSFGKGFSFIDINRLLPRGVGAFVAERVFPSEDELWNVLRDIALLAGVGIQSRVESVPHCWVHSRASCDGLPKKDVESILRCIRPCYMAINQIALDPLGCMKLCPGATSFSSSLLEVSLNKIWESHPLLKQRREFAFLPRCCIDFGTKKACPNFYACGGGCKMAAKGEEPRPGKADPLIVPVATTYMA